MNREVDGVRVSETDVFFILSRTLKSNFAMTRGLMCSNEVSIGTSILRAHSFSKQKFLSLPQISDGPNFLIKAITLY